MSYLDLDGHVEATELNPGVFVVSAHGPTDERVAGALRRTLIPVAAADGAVVYLDLENAHGIDGATLQVIGEAAHLVRMRGERLRIVTQSTATIELIDGCGLGNIVLLADSARG